MISLCVTQVHFGFPLHLAIVLVCRRLGLRDSASPWAITPAILSGRPHFPSGDPTNNEPLSAVSHWGSGVPSVGNNAIYLYILDENSGAPIHVSGIIDKCWKRAVLTSSGLHA